MTASEVAIEMHDGLLEPGNVLRKHNVTYISAVPSASKVTIKMHSGPNISTLSRESQACLKGLLEFIKSDHLSTDCPMYSRPGSFIARDPAIDVTLGYRMLLSPLHRDTFRPINHRHRLHLHQHRPLIAARGYLPKDARPDTTRCNWRARGQT